MKKQFFLTKDGLEELRVEHASLVKQRGPIAERIKSAREFGDLAENAEYSSARQEQEKVEARISEIEHILQNMKIISKPKGDNKFSGRYFHSYHLVFVKTSASPFFSASS